MTRNAKEWHAGDSTWYGAVAETAIAFGGLGLAWKGVKTAGSAIKGLFKGALKVETQAIKGLDLATSSLGKAIRENAIPAGSKLEYLGPGRLKYDGVEFRAVRDLGHLDESYLKTMLRDGVNAKDVNGIRIDGHHYKQQYHRENSAFIVYIPEPNHCISNKIQHPKGTSGGLKPLERKDWKSVNRCMNKELARTEFLRRGINPNGK